MLGRRATAFFTGLLLSGVTACGTAASAHSGGAPADRTPSATVTPASAHSPVDVVMGGFANLRYGTAARGYLRVSVLQKQDAQRGPSTTVTFERYVSCHDSVVSGGKKTYGCTLAWKESTRAATFTLDPQLATASLLTSLRGEQVRVTWTGFGEVRRQANQNGNLLVELRDAGSDARWGDDRYVTPQEPDTASQLYRRVTPAGGA